MLDEGLRTKGRLSLSLLLRGIVDAIWFWLLTIKGMQPINAELGTKFKVTCA